MVKELAQLFVLQHFKYFTLLQDLLCLISTSFKSINEFTTLNTETNQFVNSKSQISRTSLAFAETLAV